MIEDIDPQDYLAWNYDFFRVHRVIPPVGAAKRGAFKLKDLQITALDNAPGFGRSILASLLMRMYDSLWIQIDTPKDLLVNPGEKTMNTLAQHCHHTARLKHDTLLGDA
jgi:hypothetical protein